MKLSNLRRRTIQTALFAVGATVIALTGVWAIGRQSRVRPLRESARLIADLTPLRSTAASTYSAYQWSDNTHILITRRDEAVLLGRSGPSPIVAVECVDITTGRAVAEPTIAALLMEAQRQSDIETKLKGFRGLPISDYTANLRNQQSSVLRVPPGGSDPETIRFIPAQSGIPTVPLNPTLPQSNSRPPMSLDQYDSWILRHSDFWSRIDWSPELKRWFRIVYNTSGIGFGELEIRESNTVTKVVRLPPNKLGGYYLGLTSNGTALISNYWMSAETRHVFFGDIDILHPDKTPTGYAVKVPPHFDAMRVALSLDGQHLLWAYEPTRSTPPKPSLSERILNGLGWRRNSGFIEFWVTDLHGGNPRPVGSLDQKIGPIGRQSVIARWSPDGKHISVQVGRKLYVIPWDG